jgi:hypothetical protein
LVGVYVDDLVITGTNEEEVEAFKAEMKAAFQMSDLGLLSFYLGSRSTRTLRHLPSLDRLRQAHRQVGRAHRLQPSSHSHGGEAEAKSRQHGKGGRCHTVHIVGSPCYLHTWPDLAFAIGYVSRFMQ